MTTAARSYGAATASAYAMGASSMFYPMGSSSRLTAGMKPDMRYAANRQQMFNPYVPGMAGVAMAGSAFSRTSNFLGKASPWAMIGGMGLSALGNEMGPDSTAGKGLSIAGNALGMAGTGAMIGSMVGPLGTTIGAVVGGVGSLLYSLYDSMKEVEGEVEKGKDTVAFNEAKWRKQAEIYTKMNWKDKAYNDYLTNNSGSVMKHAGGGLPERNEMSSTTVILQMDGVEKLRKTTTDLYVKELINLGY